eukprot:GHVS01063811.1.p1 GENE.GHVS01063811.1~~GHVS01063811.1.p1  ORF type:complete len:267 (+),score=83.07 GHVS01063811.1:148-948(+)
MGLVCKTIKRLCSCGQSGRFCCLSLCAGCLLVAGLLVILGIIDIVAAVEQQDQTKGRCVLLMTGIFALVAAAAIAVAVLLKNSIFMYIVFVFSLLLILFYILVIIVMWIIWGHQLFEGTMKLQLPMVVHTIMWVITTTLLIDVSSAFLSLARLWATGVATGWDYISPAEARKAKELSVQLQEADLETGKKEEGGEEGGEDGGEEGDKLQEEDEETKDRQEKESEEKKEEEAKAGEDKKKQQEVVVPTAAQQVAGPKQQVVAATAVV